MVKYQLVFEDAVHERAMELGATDDLSLAVLLANLINEEHERRAAVAAIRVPRHSAP